MALIVIYISLVSTRYRNEPKADWQKLIRFFFQVRRMWNFVTFKKIKKWVMIKLIVRTN